MKIAIIDDCAVDRQQISLGIQGFLKQQNDAAPAEVTCYGSGEAFLSSFVGGEFDLILLDCCMEGLNGIETASEIRKLDERVALVFITTSTDYAVDGYLVAASGYLTKPFTDQNFARVMRIALRGNAPEYLLLPTVPFKTKLLLRDIVFCDTDGHYIQVYRQTEPVLRVRMTFAALRNLLAPYPAFLETYRGCILNMAHIQQAEEMNFLMDSGVRVPFRVKNHKELLQKYSEYLFAKVRAETE